MQEAYTGWQESAKDTNTRGRLNLVLIETKIVTSIYMSMSSLTPLYLSDLQLVVVFFFFYFFYFIMQICKLKKRKTYAVGIVPNSNRIMVERDKINTPNTRIHDRSLPCLGKALQ